MKTSRCASASTSGRSTDAATTSPAYAVNTAARIMSSAEPGQILTSAVVAQTTSAATFTTLGSRALKGLDGTWEIFTTD